MKTIEHVYILRQKAFDIRDKKNREGTEEGRDRKCE